VKLVVTTRDELRHRLFLALLEERLGRPPDGVLIQTRPHADLRPKTADRLRGLAVRTLPDPLRVHHPARTLGRLRTHPEPAAARLARKLEPLQPVSLDALEARTRLRIDADPNSPESAAWLEELAPDAALVFGGRILREPWLSLPPLGTFNLHYGILPWYAGGASTDYALYHDRFDRVGVTVHRIDEGVDSGPIVERRVVSPASGGELEDVEAEVYRTGLEAHVENALRLAAGRELELEPQHGTTVYRRGPATLAVEAVAQLRLRTEAAFPAVQRTVERVPRARGLFGRMPQPGVPPGLYVLLYHSIVDESESESWERSFRKVATDASRFRAHLELAARELQPIGLGDAWELLREGPPQRPYVVVTFDDGYANLMRTAVPICAEHGISPTVFVCSAFAAQESVHYRLLLAELIARGHAEAAASTFACELGDRQFGPDNVYDRSKNVYRPGTTEQATAEAWQAEVGETFPRGHLNWAELRLLHDAGWTIGNHTLEHTPLVGLDDGQLERQIVENGRRLAAERLEPLPWLSYPLGRSDHVDPRLGRFMNAHPDLMGIFANGGVNLFPSRREWLRIAVGNETAGQLREMLFREARATHRAVETLLR